MIDPEIVTRIEKLVGTRIERFERVEGGYTPALRLLCKTAKYNLFAKVGVTPLTGEFLRREIQVCKRIHGPFMPRFIAAEDTEFEPILVIEDLSAHYWPPPWTEKQIEMARTQIEAMHNTPVVLESFAEVNGSIEAGWQAVARYAEGFLSLGIADRQWLEAALPSLIEYEAKCSTEGNSLTHCDLRSDNICLSGTQAILVDWNLACLSNPKLDLGFWLPSLAFEGGPLPEMILPDAPEVAAWVSGFFAGRAGLPPIPDAPRVRRVQKEQLSTALPWAIRALGLEPLPLPH